ncbi:DNA processing protein [Chryseobacterium rhizoplanae]|uniref:DNA processing protein n=1 Tax=Chryseobacterium rhizoplanae TaxID=1609531 RepID=A0A521DJI6_9FLAO|nr:DNA-processing protein DprA [Chryseobacterium rhizoplanae]SMO71836.1 DNA processing protein [Chryseobacterium rhizoplanae]
MQISTFNDYYSKLTTVEKKNSPKELFYKGDFSLLENGRRVAVVGSRKVSELGLKRTHKIARFLVKNDITVVSGLAEGVDSIAHRTAIDFQGNTIGVIGTPLNKYFPIENKDLQDFIAEKHLLISQFPENYPVTPKSFPIRNRTMALISDATIIVEASEKSGTKHQGWEALRLGRQLLIMENVLNDNISWAEEMLSYGAQVLTQDNFEFLIESIPFLTTKREYVF